MGRPSGRLELDATARLGLRMAVALTTLVQSNAKQACIAAHIGALYPLHCIYRGPETATRLRLAASKTVHDQCRPCRRADRFRPPPLQALRR